MIMMFCKGSFQNESYIFEPLFEYAWLNREPIFRHLPPLFKILVTNLFCGYIFYNHFTTFSPYSFKNYLKAKQVEIRKKESRIYL